MTVHDEDRAMLAEMGLRHPLDCTPQERAAGMAAQHARIARAFERYVAHPAEARRLAEGEYAIRPRSGGYTLLSRGADGGMHYRGRRRTRAEAEQWLAERIDSLAEDILSGRLDGTLVFLDGRGRAYIG